ncbi:hypothetical protein BLS_003676 [Venturia inaequalis]|uniref:Exocyst complex component Sec6 n=1 Tax=Venturia inaequalis TaxID=5025 RepID=A0A8H3VU32_VENIN|nr:hypothetical protein BLS_003676 [Venturia inaequalis]KAE9977728.1 hypothetical protein EG328_001855 [Venturia inaequalis]KAE9992928.1 hypothetical protein EG327_007236 [Venturia inaequalis]RDI78145.1 hypothetical protein Vi05172_g11875 [Venturia inaequalis]
MNDVDSVTFKLAELLRHPEDLDKIAGLKSDFTRKKAAVDSQLRIGLQEQLSVTQSGMSSISTGQQSVDLIKAEMQKIDKLCFEAQTLIEDFPQINLVAQTHRNFTLVKTMKEEIEGFDTKLFEIQDMLKEDDADPENQPNLLAIHVELTKLRDIRDSAMGQAKRSGEAVEELINNLDLPTGHTLQHYFSQLDEVVEWFDEHIGTACMNLIPLVNQGNNGLITRLALVIHNEEKADAKARALQEAQSDFKELAARFQSITYGQKEIRGYKEKFDKAIELYAEAGFDGATEEFYGEPERLDKVLRWYFDHLFAAKVGLVDLMPKKWKIFETYVRIYHRKLHDWLISLIDDPQTSNFQHLAIVNWEPKYYTKMKKLFDKPTPIPGNPQSWLMPHLIDNRAGDLVRETRQDFVKRIDEYVDNIAMSDSKAFKAYAKEAIEHDEKGLWRTKTAADIWIMLRENLDAVAKCGRPEIVEGVAEAMFRALQNRQRMWEHLIDQELEICNDMTALNDEHTTLMDWLISIANDQMACIEDGDDTQEAGSQSYLSRFDTEVKGIVSPDFIPTVDTNIDTIKLAYVDLSTHCLAAFSRLIMVDFKQLLTEIFTPAWYNNTAMFTFVGTFEDYRGDYASTLSESLIDILAEIFSDQLLIAYLGCVRNKGVKFRRNDPFVDKIKDDAIAVFNYFSIDRFNSAESIKTQWRAVIWLGNFLEAPKDAIPEVYEEFKQEYWDAGMGWVEACLRARDDFDRGLLNAVKAKAATVEVKRGEETIMGKVK